MFPAEGKSPAVYELLAHLFSACLEVNIVVIFRGNLKDIGLLKSSGL